MKEIKIINKVVGIMYLDTSEEWRYKLLDSNKNYVGYTCSWDEENDLEKIIIKLINIKDITEIVNLGFCNNMIFGKSTNDLLDTYSEFVYNSDYYERDSFNIKEIEETIEEYHNQIGDNYFIVDYDEL